MQDTSPAQNIFERSFIFMMQSKAKINNTMYDVCTLQQYTQNPNQYLPNHTAIIEGDYLYPVLSSTQIGTGVHVIPGLISYFTQPKENEEEYRKENAIRFDDVKDIATMIDKLDAVKKIESDVLTSVDNIFTAKVKPGDAPEMIALKTAVNEKKIDLDKYEHRFGSNYHNDKRLFNKPTISLGMLKRVTSALDMKVTLTIEDMPDAPNPIGRKIEVQLNGRDVDEEE